MKEAVDSHGSRRRLNTRPSRLVAREVYEKSSTGFNILASLMQNACVLFVKNGNLPETSTHYCGGPAHPISWTADWEAQPFAPLHINTMSLGHWMTEQSPDFSLVVPAIPWTSSTCLWYDHAHQFISTRSSSGRQNSSRYNYKIRQPACRLISIDTRSSGITLAGYYLQFFDCQELIWPAGGFVCVRGRNGVGEEQQVGGCVASGGIVGGARGSEGSWGVDEEAPKDAGGVRAGAAGFALGRQLPLHRELDARDPGDREPEPDERGRRELDGVGQAVWAGDVVQRGPERGDLVVRVVRHAHLHQVLQRHLLATGGLQCVHRQPHHPHHRGHRGVLPGEGVCHHVHHQHWQLGALQWVHGRCALRVPLWSLSGDRCMGGLTAISLNIKLASMLACSWQLMFQYFDDEFITMAITSWDLVSGGPCVSVELYNWWYSINSMNNYSDFLNCMHFQVTSLCFFFFPSLSLEDSMVIEWQIRLLPPMCSRYPLWSLADAWMDTNMHSVDICSSQCS